MTYIPDPIELGEARAERWAAESIRGDEFKCAGCENWFSLAVAQPASSDPYSAAICPECAGLSRSEERL